MLDMSSEVLAYKAGSVDAAQTIHRDCICCGLSTSVKGDMVFCRSEHRDCVAMVVVFWNLHQNPGFRDALLNRMRTSEDSS